MTGRRLALSWCQRIRNIKQTTGNPIYTLLDAAALVSTAPLDLSDANQAPDFVALSFYKIFGFPDVGALIVRKDSGQVLRARKYFGGGTVDSVTVLKDGWHAKKEASLHSCLEDGTIPFHNIIALQSALQVHTRLYGSMSLISRHASFLASALRDRLVLLQHGNGREVCTIYSSGFATPFQGPVIAFNLKDERGNYISNAEVEKLAVVRNIQFRTGGLCNPGGTASHLGLSAEEMRSNYAAGQRCGSENDIVNGKPTGTIRVSVGAMSSLRDISKFVDFIEEFYVSTYRPRSDVILPVEKPANSCYGKFVVESLSVFPIKSCAAYKIPSSVAWEIGPKGLAWDREWCLVHAGTNVALSQKKFPAMALVRPEIDLIRRVLKISAETDGGEIVTLEVGLDTREAIACDAGRGDTTTSRSSIVCGEDIDVEVYTSIRITEFFSDILRVPCTLARFPRHGTIRQAQVRVPGRTLRGKEATETGRSIALANESPILLVSRSSVNRLNEQIKRNGGIGKAVAAASFRGNIVIAEDLEGGQKETPYAEDDWETLGIGHDPTSSFEVLGPCQRCQMVCVDQKNAERRQEPFSTLAKTRRKHGRVWFGMHMCLNSRDVLGNQGRPVYVRAGDRVIPRNGRV